MDDDHWIISTTVKFALHAAVNVVGLSCIKKWTRVLHNTRTVDSNAAENLHYAELLNIANEYDQGLCFSGVTFTTLATALAMTSFPEVEEGAEQSKIAESYCRIYLNTLAKLCSRRPTITPYFAQLYGACVHGRYMQSQALNGTYSIVILETVQRSIANLHQTMLPVIFNRRVVSLERCREVVQLTLSRASAVALSIVHTTIDVAIAEQGIALCCKEVNEEIAGYLEYSHDFFDKNPRLWKFFSEHSQLLGLNHFDLLVRCVYVQGLDKETLETSLIPNAVLMYCPSALKQNVALKNAHTKEGGLDAWAEDTLKRIFYKLCKSTLCGYNKTDLLVYLHR